VSALLLAGGVVSCAANPRVTVEAPTCPEPPDALFAEDLPEGWEDWYLNELEPFCHALYRAAIEVEGE